MPVATSERIGAGTVIPFALDELIDAETSPAGAMFSGKVAADVMGTDGKLAVPQGSAGVVLVGEAWKKEGTSVLSVLLYQLTVNGHSYLLGRSQGQMPRLDYRDEAAKGTAHRTVHLERDQILKFSLKEPLRFNP